MLPNLTCFLGRGNRISSQSLSNVLQGDASVQGDVDSSVGESVVTEEKPSSFSAEQTNRGSFSSRSSLQSPRVADKFEPIDIEGQKETGIWIQQPGSEVSQTWEPRKGKSRRLDTEIIRGTPSATAYENQEDKHSENRMRRGLRKFSSVFHRTARKDDQLSVDGDLVSPPLINVREVNSNKISVNLIVEKDRNLSPDGSGSESPGKGNVTDKAKGFFKKAEKSARCLKQALSKKGSRRSRSGNSSIENIPSDSDSTDDESLPPSYTPRADNTIPVASQPISSAGASDSPKSPEKGRVSTDSSEITIDSGNVTKEKLGQINDLSSPKLAVMDVIEEKDVDLNGVKG